VNPESKDWMLTITRRQVWPLALKIEDINIADIARPLGNQCRYNGHVDEFYSVAEHSVLISRALERDGEDARVCLIGLHHDDCETWLGDMIKPLKNALEKQGVSLKPYELAAEELISKKFGLPWPWPAVIKEYDNKIVRDEKEQLKAGGPDWTAFGIPSVGLNIVLPCWEPKRAAREYIHRHVELTEAIKKMPFDSGW